MTNRERAEAVIASVSTVLATHADRVEAIAKALDEAERRGRIDLLAWMEAHPGTSWIATISDVKEAIDALEAAPVHATGEGEA